MKIQALAIATLMLAGTAFAAAPAETSSTTTTTTTTTHKHHRTVKTAKVKKQKHHAVRHASAMHHGSAMHHASAAHRGTEMGNAGAPQTDVNDSARQARMDEALTKYRNNPG